MVIPIGTDNPLQRRPAMNYALVALNVAIFLLTFRSLNHNPMFPGAFVDPHIDILVFSPQQPELFQFITYAFLHGGWMHLIGNMLFLYIFGNSVNSKLGNLGYLLLYLAGGIFSALGHAFQSGAPVLGASGAVAAITGAYMVLFPKTYIHIIYFFYFIGTTEIPALWFILFKLIIWDNILGPRIGGPSNIAYSAHLAGYAFGVAVPLILLIAHTLPHSQYDLWALVQRWRRRQQFSRVVEKGYDPFRGQAPGRRTVFTPEQPKPEPQLPEAMVQLRGEISQALSRGELPRAGDLYQQMVARDPGMFLPQQQQLDIANQLMQDGRHPLAAKAYEDFLSHYPRYPFIEQVQLMLGLLYSRYLHDPAQARTHLQAALARLSNDIQKQMAQDELKKLEGES